MEKRELKVGDVVQINPESDPVFGAHFMIVTEPKSWGAQGYCEVFPVTDATSAVVTFKGLAYYRCKFENMEYVGRTSWIRESNEDDDDGQIV